MKVNSIAPPTNKNRRHWLIFDPIPFNGGSKIATKEALNQCPDDIFDLTIITSEKQSWEDSFFTNKHSVSIVSIYCPNWLQTATTGWRYWLKQLYYSMLIIWQMIVRPKMDTAIGASGPGVDMALYLCGLLFNYRLIQFVHGPVASSRSIGYCLCSAHAIFYLSSSRKTLKNALTNYYRTHLNVPIGEDLANFNMASPHYFEFKNGLGQHNWPTPCIYGEPSVFWAASLLKWKGLDTLVEAGKKLAHLIPIDIHVCYIRPHATDIDITEAPVEGTQFYWYQQPHNLDEIRSRHSIFVSTSHNEPFGLSVLEALAAGMCVFIPKDGAYWDKKLTHNLNCIKYKPGNASSLTEALFRLILKPNHIVRIGLAGYKVAQQYQAEECYQNIVTILSKPSAQHALNNQKRRC